MAYNQQTLAELKKSYPDLEIFWHYHEVPINYLSKSSLKKKRKWQSNLKPVAVKGNSLIKGGHYLLYKEPE